MTSLSFDQRAILFAIPTVLLAIVLIDLRFAARERRAPVGTRASRASRGRGASRRAGIPGAPEQPAGSRRSSHRPIARIRLPAVTPLLPISRRARLALGVRLVLVMLIALALAGPNLYTSIGREAVVFIADLSASVSSQEAEQAAWIQRALNARHPGDLAGIVVAGRDPLAELAVTADPRFTSFQSIPDRNWTNLAQSLSLAAAMLPSDARRRVVLLTDGWQNVGDVLQQARLLRAEGIVVDVVPVAPPSGPEVRVDAVSAPPTIGEGERFSLAVRIASTMGETSTLRVFVDGSPAGTQQVSIQPGEQVFNLSQTAPAAGAHRYRVDLEPTRDSIPQNNTGQAIVRVTGPPRVVVAEGGAGVGQNLATALRANGYQVTVVSASALPITSEGLLDYDAIVLVDVPARDLGAQRMSAIQTYVRDLGRGLLVIGGENSYGLGAYAGTPLEQTLPVTMEIPQRKEIPTVAVALIVENLENATGNDSAKEAAKKVVDQLTPRDEVMVSDAATGFPVPLQHVTDRTAIQKAIDAMNTGDPPTYAPYLVGAANALVGSSAKVKHIILVGDGDAQDDYEPIVQQIVDRGITVSAVATAAHEFADAPTMQAIARWGHGRYYEATDFGVPQALLKEAHTVIRPAMIQGRFVPQALGASSLLAGITTLPALDGYVATTPRPIASIALVSDQGDPILASWQYGLGRSIAWTSDASGLWTKDMVRWPGAGQFWAQLVAWVVPTPGDSSWQVTATQNGPAAEIVAETDRLGNLPNNLDARIVGPDNAATTLTLLPVAPGRYEGSAQVGAAGAYSVHVSAPTGQSPTAVDGQLVVPYSPEYRTSGADEPLIEQVARVGGGKVLDDPTQAFADDLPSASGGTPLWRWLLGAAALLLVLDVAVRRLNFSGRDLEPALNPMRRLGAAIADIGIAGSSATRLPADRAAEPSLEASSPRSAHTAQPALQEPDSATKEVTLHTTRLLAARRRRTGQRERSDR